LPLGELLIAASIDDPAKRRTNCSIAILDKAVLTSSNLVPRTKTNTTNKMSIVLLINQKDYGDKNSVDQYKSISKKISAVSACLAVKLHRFNSQD